MSDNGHCLLHLVQDILFFLTDFKKVRHFFTKHNTVIITIIITIIACNITVLVMLSDMS